MKIVVVDKSNPDQKKYLTPKGTWDHRIREAKDFDRVEAHEEMKRISKKNDFIEVQAY